MRFFIKALIFIIFLFTLFVFPPSLKAQDNELVLMGLAAHPDDEDGATLAYYAKFKRIKTYSLIFTRGEGGQNEIGSSLYNDLANIRTQESFEAGKRIGAETYFLNFPDFGFSKTARETFIYWGGKDSALSRLVYFIRKLRPDVIITNHDTITTKPYRQHGNHQAVGIIAYEAFEKAADSTFHPEQFQLGVTPWQVKKLFVRLFRPHDLKNPRWQDSLIHINIKAKGSDSLSMLDIALDALSQHRSQGMDKLSPNMLPWFYQPRNFLIVRALQTFTLSNEDLFSGISPSTRFPISLTDIQEPKLAAFEINSYPTHILKETATEEELRQVVSPQYQRQIIIQMQNRTKQIVPIVLNISLNYKSLFRKAYVFAGRNKECLIDTISLALDKNTSISIDSLYVEASPIGIEAQTYNLTKVRNTIALIPIQSTFKKPIAVGLVNTYDNTLSEILSSFSIPYKLLDSVTLASKSLNSFSTILLDIRSYGYRSDLIAYNSRVLDYVFKGGNVVCFYNKVQDWNDKSDSLQGFAPYPITLTAERVTEEHATVKMLFPNHTLMTFPNKLSDKTWEKWVQERSIYLPSDDPQKTSEKYTRLLSMSDEHDSQPSTSLLWTRYGKGTYTYCSLALYRQLRTLNEGGVSLFFNLISQ